MIHLMSSGGYKVFTESGQFIGAYNNEQLATEIDRLGKPLTSEEFDNLFGVHESTGDAQK